MEAALRSRALLILSMCVGVLVAWLAWRTFSSSRQPSAFPAPTIIKLPVAFANHTFDPMAPPPGDMPPLNPWENAECDSNFLSSANVHGESRPADGTHATVTITQVSVTLQLSINIWVPTGAPQRVIEHEEGHRQVSEYYYQTADKLAQKIAASYLGKQVDISGTNLATEFNKALQQTAREIADEYNRELNPAPTQLLYDSITDHGRNETVVRDAVAHAIKNVSVESTQSTTNPRN